VANVDSPWLPLPEDREALRALVQTLLKECDQQKQQAAAQQRQAEEQRQRTVQLEAELLRLQVELERYKRWYYGPRADRLRTTGELAQLLLQFAEELDRKPIIAVDSEQSAEPAERGVQRRKGRRDLARFEDLPVTTHVYELSETERACPGCGQERKEIGAEESWQVEYIPGRFERLQHVRKKYACPRCEQQGDSPQITAAVKPEQAIDKGLAGPGLLAYIVTSKFNEYTPLYRLEDVFARQGFEISRGTQAVWCRDVADVAEPLYERMTDGVRRSHVVATDDTILPIVVLVNPIGKKAVDLSSRSALLLGDDSSRSRAESGSRFQRGQESPWT
jgi:transposase